MFDIAKERESTHKFYVPILEDSNEKNVLDYLFADEEQRREANQKPNGAGYLIKNKV